LTKDALDALDGLEEEAGPAEVAQRLDGKVSPAFLLLAEGLMVQSNGLGSLLSAVDGLGGFEAQYAQIEKVSAHHGDNWEVLLHGHLKADRPVMFDMTDVIELKATSEDTGVLDALLHSKAHRTPARDYIPDRDADGRKVDVSFATQNWQKVIRDRRRPGYFVRRHFEAMVFYYLADELRTGDVAVIGSEEYADWSEQLLPWEQVDAKLSEYLVEVGLRETGDATPFDGRALVALLRGRLTEAAAKADGEYPDNDELFIDPDTGVPKLKPRRAKGPRKSVERLEQAIKERMPERSLLGIVARTAYWIEWWHRFGPASGNDPKLKDPFGRYVITTFVKGTNMTFAEAARHIPGVSGHELSYVANKHFSIVLLNEAVADLVNAHARLDISQAWGDGTAVAADGTHMDTYLDNLLSETSVRYGRGVLIYWHVEKKSLAIHSQLINCTASEVAAMIEGAMRHGTTMDVEANYTDSHGQSETEFGITRLLNFDLLPRIKRINKVKLYRPVAGEPDAYPQLTPALTRPIRWELIAQQYDQMIKYATAIRTRTAYTEAILRRFTRNASHPTYAAMLEVGRAQKTIFVARYLRLRDLQREIEEGLNVMESSNGANSVIAYGKGGEIASNRRDEQEMFVLCLRILQSALVYVNTLMLQDILGEPEWADLLTPADRRGLTPLFWSHVRPYGEVNLDMGARLDLAAASVPGPRTPADQAA
jgi:TnpA family transposase